MSLIPGRLDVLARAKRLLPAQFRNKTNWVKLLTAFAKPFQDIEDAFQQLLLYRAISTAVGAQLDILGELLERKRRGLDDAAYKIRLLARILIIKSSGTRPQILALLKRLKDVFYEYRDAFPASFVVETNTALTATEHAELGAAVQSAKGGGVRGAFISSVDDDDHSFTFADDEEMEDSADQGFADAPFLVTDTAPYDGEFGPGSSAVRSLATDGAGTWVHVNSAGAVVSTNDGVSFFFAATPHTSVDVSMVYFAGGFFFAGYVDGTLYRSVDGQAWTQCTLDALDDPQSIAFGDGVWVVQCIGGIQESADGLTFATATSNFANGYFFGVIWNEPLSLFVALGGGEVSTSPDGATWTLRDPDFGDAIYMIAVNPNDGAMVLIGDDSIHVASSADGITWSASTIAVTSITGVTWMLGKFWVVGTNHVFHSIDGAAWTSVGSGTGLSNNNVGGLFTSLYAMIATDLASLKAVSSSDGLTWSEFYLPDLGGAAAVGTDSYAAVILDATKSGRFELSGGSLAGVI